MARISDIGLFNNERKEFIKVLDAEKNTILFTKEEAREALIRYIDEELELFSNGIADSRKKEINDRVNNKLKNLEEKLMNHINNKIDAVVEGLAERTINRVIEEEVNKRLEIKLTKIKNLL